MKEKIFKEFKMNKNTDQKPLQRHHICCDLVTQSQRYADILETETERLSELKLQSNQLLESFYAAINEQNYLINETLPIKYLGADDSRLTEEYITEFSSFVKSVWQIGKRTILGEERCIEYKSIVGSPLEEVLSNIKSFVDDLVVRLAYMTYHGKCTNLMREICSQINDHLQYECLASSDACVQQHLYLQEAVPFLQELNSLINKYLLLPDIHTPKHFVSKVIVNNPLVTKLMSTKDSADTEVFRYVIDLLNGKLLGEEVLDQKSDIKPVVEHNYDFERNDTIMLTVDWIIQQHKNKTDSTFFDNFVIVSQKHNLVNNREHGTMMNCVKNVSDNSKSTNPPHQCDTLNPSDITTSNWTLKCGRLMSPQPTVSSRRSGSNRKRKSESFKKDLPPLKVQSIKPSLLPPLL